MKGQCYLFHLKTNKWTLCRFYTTLVCLYPSLEGVLARSVHCCLDPKIWIFALGRTFPDLGGQDISLIGTFYLVQKLLKRKADSWPMSLSPKKEGSGCRQGKNSWRKFYFISVCGNKQKSVFLSKRKCFFGERDNTHKNIFKLSLMIKTVVTLLMFNLSDLVLYEPWLSHLYELMW